MGHGEGHGEGHGKGYGAVGDDWHHGLFGCLANPKNCEYHFYSVLVRS